MGFKVVDTWCEACGAEYKDVWTDGAYPECCGKPTSWRPHVPKTTEWGGPRTYLHLRDEPFSSRSELDAWTKAQGMVPSASNDKSGGARNEDHLNTGRIYSYSK